ncbi:MAG: glutamate--cysteine ligase [Granulosicoccus sp.]|nr:glutamate--cysteine ligase [Granulosicoccus sp.]
MGDEIEKRYFGADDFRNFRERLETETALLQGVFRDNEFSQRGEVAGFELEAWLIDEAGDPLPVNEAFLEHLNNPLVVPELAAFNVELNGSPSRITGRLFSRLHDELASNWNACCRTASELGCSMLAIGILPTVQQEMLCAQNMSAQVRYRSLNDRVLALRDGQPLGIKIDGDEPLQTTHADVMLEAAATSFQIHLQCRPENAVRDFNASMIISAPMVAVSANSPYLFGHSLWDETRIPLFEQAVDVGPNLLSRVGFGQDYAHESLFEIFEQNRKDYRLLLPAVQTSPAHEFRHVRFHNGTLWRWNRPLIGFDFDGQPHLRIEHRVVAAGPTLRDSIANSAFYFGLVRGLTLSGASGDYGLPFEQARANFYRCAREGLNATVRWPGRKGVQERSIRALIVDDLLPLARNGLQASNIPDAEIDEYLEIIAARADSSQNGATWQRRWVARHGTDMRALVKAYQALQQDDVPVHQWSV